jgi:hypothetical protein
VYFQAQMQNMLNNDATNSEPTPKAEERQNIEEPEVIQQHPPAMPST